MFRIIIFISIFISSSFVFAKKPRAEGICCHWQLGTLGVIYYDEVVLDSGSARSFGKFMIKDYAMSHLQSAVEGKYNEYLNSNPNLEGTIVIKFTVTHNGRVINDTILSSTTKNEKFDKNIRMLLRKSKWEKIDSGTTTATVPFTFWKSADDYWRDNPGRRMSDSIIKHLKNSPRWRIKEVGDYWIFEEVINKPYEATWLEITKTDSGYVVYNYPDLNYGETKSPVIIRIKGDSFIKETYAEPTYSCKLTNIKKYLENENYYYMLSLDSSVMSFRFDYVDESKHIARWTLYYSDRPEPVNSYLYIDSTYNAFPIVDYKWDDGPITDECEPNCPLSASSSTH